MAWNKQSVLYENILNSFGFVPQANQILFKGFFKLKEISK